MPTMIDNTAVCAMTAFEATTAIPWKDLDAKGYVVVPAFLTAAEIDVFRTDYEAEDRAAKARQAMPDEATRAADGIDVPYKLRLVTASARAVIEAKLASVARTVASGTTVRVDHHAHGSTFGSAYFATDGDVGLSWHQDSVSYHAYQNHHDYLNFYIPIVKPRRDQSNLCVVPFDALEARSPAICNRLRGKGATRFVATNGATIARNNDRGGTYGVLPYLLDEIAITPELDAGDLLLLRGDVIHRTQDTATRRVALSLRMMNARTPVTRAQLVRGGFMKTLLMIELRSDFQHLLDCFDAAGRDQLTVRELTALEATVAVRARPPSQVRFLARLLRYRLGVWLRRRRIRPG